MFNAPLMPGANLFFWIVLLLVGFAHWLIIVDAFYGKKKKKENGDQAH
jgi:hypothetical protein